jgi:hypothetical protein
VIAANPGVGEIRIVGVTAWWSNHNASAMLEVDVQSAAPEIGDPDSVTLKKSIVTMSSAPRTDLTRRRPEQFFCAMVCLLIVGIDDHKGARTARRLAQTGHKTDTGARMLVCDFRDRSCRQWSAHRVEATQKRSLSLHWEDGKTRVSQLLSVRGKNGFRTCSHGDSDSDRRRALRAATFISLSGGGEKSIKKKRNTDRRQLNFGMTVIQENKKSKLKDVRRQPASERPFRHPHFFDFSHLIASRDLTAAQEMLGSNTSEISHLHVGQ